MNLITSGFNGGTRIFLPIFLSFIFFSIFGFSPKTKPIYFFVKKGTSTKSPTLTLNFFGTEYVNLLYLMVVIHSQHLKLRCNINYINITIKIIL